MSFSHITKRFIYAFFPLICMTLLSGCISGIYVDPALSEKTAQLTIKQPIKKSPVQVVVEAQTNGIANPRVTALIKNKIINEIKSSELFSQIDETGKLTNSKLMISLNNVVMTENVTSQGFVTGLTFGLAGTGVTDGYIFTITYIPNNGKAPVEKKVIHAIHTTLGAKKAPVAVKPEKSLDDAVNKMLKEIVHAGLYELSIDENFE